ALRALKQKCPKIIFDYHGVTPPEQIVSPGKRLIAEKTIAVTKEGADCADLCLVRSHFMEHELRDYSKPRKIIFNPLPFLPIKSEILPLREKYHLENKKILLYVGRISEHKNLAVVIGALQKIEKKDVCFVVVGNDKHLSLAAEKERLIDLSRKLKVQDQIIFTGEVSEAELFSWYKSCGLFIMPSLHEGFCWPLVDAMAYGAPILATREGAIPETVGNAALFFDAKNPSDLSAKLIQILDNQELRGQLARLGKEKAKEYSWERYKNVLLNAVQD
ncbi:MAG: glycosyltransferase family 1 protein, partial [bacterium]|nr:glycosyltransferase family 1 protein [bacterium]